METDPKPTYSDTTARLRSETDKTAAANIAAGHGKPNAQTQAFAAKFKAQVNKMEAKQK